MATRVFRFRFEGPPVSTIEGLVTGSLIKSQASLTITQDWTFDDAETNPEDLVHVLDEYGWVFESDVNAD